MSTDTLAGRPSSDLVLRRVSRRRPGDEAAENIRLVEMKRRSKQPERSFPFLTINERQGKPRERGLTEIRGPYYSVLGRRYLEDLFETMGAYVDSLKFAGGSFTLMPERAI